MIYGSVCSGIEAASVAWEPLGWRPSFFSEIDAFPRAVLQHRFPEVPLHGDFTTICSDDYEPIDLLVGGTPCQSFSVAGLRGGLGDDRGNLALEYLRLADRLRPRWLVWENVPGVLSSNGGRDFGSILGGLVELGYGFAYRVLDAQHVRVDGLERAVPQRRRRVFVVGYIGDWRRAAAVLFERESLSGHPAPRREAGERTADCLTVGANQYSGFCGEPVEVIASTGDISHCLNAGGMGRQDYETETLIAAPIQVSPTLRAGGNATGGDRPPGTDVDTCDSLIPYTLAIRGRGDGHDLEYRQDGTANAILTPNGGRAGIGVGAIAFSAKDHGADACEEVSPTLRAGGFTGSHANGGVMPAVAFDARQSHVIQYGEISGPLDTEASTIGLLHNYAVRRLTPLECERLQGFPDGWTDAPYRGKPAADGPRYKALGNSMAVNCMRFIGQRIALVDAIPSDAAA